MYRKEKNQINSGDTEIDTSGRLRVSVLQKDNQGCDKHQNHARLHRRPEILIQASADKPALDIREHHNQHIGQKHNAETVHKLQLHIYHGNIPVPHQPQIAASKITQHKTQQICQQ